MIPELGQFSLILALCLSILLGTIPIVGAEKSNVLWMSLARPLAAGVFVFLAVSLALLAYAFVKSLLCGEGTRGPSSCGLSCLRVGC